VAAAAVDVAVVAEAEPPELEQAAEVVVADVADAAAPLPKIARAW
jgi:hypothetical protein